MTTVIQFPKGITDEVFEWLYHNVGQREGNDWHAGRDYVNINGTFWYVSTITINDDRIAALFILRWK
jgi:hypothetical protein